MAIGKISAWKLYEDLGIESLEQLEAAASDGRLEKFAGIGPKRVAGIRDTLAQHLGRIRQRLTTSVQHNGATVAELLDVDRQYREEAASGALQYIAPRRFSANAFRLACETCADIGETSRLPSTQPLRVRLILEKDE